MIYNMSCWWFWSISSSKKQTDAGRHTKREKDRVSESPQSFQTSTRWSKQMTLPSQPPHASTLCFMNRCCCRSFFIHLLLKLSTGNTLDRKHCPTACGVVPDHLLKAYGLQDFQVFSHSECNALKWNSADGLLLGWDHHTDNWEIKI